MKRPLISIALIATTLLLSGCGWSGGYRYPCQDPANWNNAECKPPICTADGWCTPTLLGFDPYAPTADVTVDPTAVDPNAVVDTTNQGN
jgi:hypothetical protein